MLAETITARSQIATTTEYVNAEIARLWLGRNTQNRPLDKNRVAHYARQMAEGRWHETAETLQFGMSGNLIDGQHRLHALVRADETRPGLTLVFQVARGVADSAFSVIGQGKTRTAADALSLAGFTDTRNLAASASFHRRAQEQNWALGLSDNEALLEYVRAHPALIECIPFTSVVSRVVLRPTLFAALSAHAIERGVPMEQLSIFADSVRSGVNLSVDSPALALRNWAMLQRANQRAVPNPEQAFVIFRALQAHIAGKGIRRLGSSVSTSSNLKFDVNDLAPKRGVK